MEVFVLSISMTPAWINVNLSPSPGFCIKSKLLQPTVLNQVALPQGLKVFINVAWSKDLPPPPDGVKKALQLATATPTDDHQTLSNNGDNSIYIFASDGGLDTDKGAMLCSREACLAYSLFCIAGKPSVVFDCVYHSFFKSYVLKDADVKQLLIGKRHRHLQVVTGPVVRSNHSAFVILVPLLIY